MDKQSPSRIDLTQPTRMTVPCGGSTHLITWSGGTITLEDHDAEAEKTIVALGAPRCECLEIFEAWNHALTAPELLPMLVGSRTRRFDPSKLRADQANQRSRLQALIRVLPGAITHVGTTATPRAINQHLRKLQAEEKTLDSRYDREYKEALLAALPESFRQRLVIGIINSCRARWFEKGFREQYAAMLNEFVAMIARPALKECLDGWRAHMRSGAPIDVECAVIGEDETPVLNGFADVEGATITAALPFSWATHVWGRGISLVENCFVLQVETETRTERTLKTIAARWKRGQDGRSSIVVEPACLSKTPDGSWRLHWTSE